jgi:vitamin B12/bleomycin/antimicrobial peptide transport system ATP-binding/permease protein
VRAFTATTLSFALMGINSALTILSFSGVLWSISPLLFVVSVLYAAFGSYLTITLARPLVKLNSDQLDREASVRSALIHVRDDAESIARRHAGEGEAVRLKERLDRLVENFPRITTVNRNVGFFSTGYNWLIQLIPILIIAPAFMRRDRIPRDHPIRDGFHDPRSRLLTRRHSVSALSTYAAVAS